MKIPKADGDKLDLYQDTVRVCLASRNDRMERYQMLRRYYLFGSNDQGLSPWNKLYSHLDTVASFLYASDSTRFNVALGSLAPKSDYSKTGPFAKRIMEEWKASNTDIVMQNAVLWSLVYNTMLVKMIRRKGAVMPYCCDPGSFGVYREDIAMLDRQEAFVQVYYSTKPELERTLTECQHPHTAAILKSVDDAAQYKQTDGDVPPFIDGVVLANQASASAPLSSLTGEVNIDLETLPDYNAKVATPLIELQELWLWDDDQEDYQVVTMASRDVVIFDRPNMFMPRARDYEAEQPFVQVCPNPMYDYFWGGSECDRLWPLQQKRNNRMSDIQRLLSMQADPPSAFFGQGLVEDKLKAFNQPGSVISTGPDGKLEQYSPTIPPDLYADIEQIDREFDEMSGLTNTAQGRGEAGVRSASHAGKLLTVGSARPKKRAQIIEDSLEKVATLMGKCLYVDDDDPIPDEEGEEFVIAQMSPHFTVEVDAHSNSPVFMENEKDNAVLLMKAKCIDREEFIRRIDPARADSTIRKLKERIIPAEQKAAAAQQAQQAQEAAAKNGGKPGLKTV